MKNELPLDPLTGIYYKLSALRAENTATECKKSSLLKPILTDFNLIGGLYDHFVAKVGINSNWKSGEIYLAKKRFVIAIIFIYAPQVYGVEKENLPYKLRKTLVSAIHVSKGTISIWVTASKSLFDTNTAYRREVSGTYQLITGMLGIDQENLSFPAENLKVCHDET